MFTYPFTAPAIRPLTSRRWKMSARITGGNAARKPPAAGSRVKLVEFLEYGGQVFLRNAYARIAYRNDHVRQSR